MAMCEYGYLGVLWYLCLFCDDCQITAMKLSLENGCTQRLIIKPFPNFYIFFFAALALTFSSGATPPTRSTPSPSTCAPAT